jgi:formate-dependent nitrite reductase cytochrome c552 subunit
VGKICAGVFLGIVLAVFFLLFVADCHTTVSNSAAQSRPILHNEYVTITRAVEVETSDGKVMLGAGLRLSTLRIYDKAVDAEYRGETVRIPIWDTNLATQR